MADPLGTALVTGASGFVGSHLVEHLTQQGIQVRALLRGTSNQRWLPASDLVEIHLAPLTDDDALDQALDGVTTVFHLAALTSASRHEDYFSTNVGGAQSLVDAMKRSAPGATLVLCSSLAAAGPARDGKPLTENDAPNPIGPYGQSKLAAERVVLESGIHAVVVRPPTVYGPRDSDILEMFRWAKRGLAPLIGRHEQRLSIIYVHDLVRALAAAARARSGSVYNVSDGRIHTRDDLSRLIAVAVARETRRIYVPVSLAMSFAHVSRLAARMTRVKPLLTPERIRDFCERDWTCDDSRARAEIGYASQVSIEEGMSETAKWYREQGWI